MLSPAISNLATRQLQRVIPDLNFAGDGQAYYTEGLHKLLSQAVFLLLTDRGSIAGVPDLGLDVRDRLSTISLTELQTVDRILSEITRDLQLQLEVLTSNAPDDERVESLLLTSFSVVGVSELQVNLSLTSVAGEQASYTTSLITRPT